VLYAYSPRVNALSKSTIPTTPGKKCPYRLTDKPLAPNQGLRNYQEWNIMTKLARLVLAIILITTFVNASNPVVFRGSWSIAHDSSSGMHINIHRGHSNNWMQTTDAINLNSLSNGPVQFKIDREAGVFQFEGVIRDGEGGGEFELHFKPKFLTEMASLGHSTISEDDLFLMACLNLTTAEVKELNALGYNKLTTEQLVEMKIHGVSPKFISDIQSRGYTDMSEEKLVEMRIHGVTPEFIDAIAAAGYRNVATNRLVEMRIHGVDPDSIRQLEKLGYKNLSLERLVEFRIHGVSPSFIEELNKAGYSNLPEERLVEFRIHGVSPNYIHELDALGYHNIPPEQLVEMRIFNVDPQYIKNIQKQKGSQPTIRELINRRIHGNDDWDDE
jgi:hypothetical protein